MVLIEDRMETPRAQAKHLADGYRDMERRLVRRKAKFDLIEKRTAPGRSTLPAGWQSHRDKKKSS